MDELPKGVSLFFCEVADDVFIGEQRVIVERLRKNEKHLVRDYIDIDQLFRGVDLYWERFLLIFVDCVEKYQRKRATDIRAIRSNLSDLVAEMREKAEDLLSLFEQIQELELEEDITVEPWCSLYDLIEKAVDIADENGDYPYLYEAYLRKPLGKVLHRYSDLKYQPSGRDTIKASLHSLLEHYVAPPCHETEPIFRTRQVSSRIVVRGLLGELKRGSDILDLPDGTVQKISARALSRLLSVAIEGSHLEYSDSIETAINSERRGMNNS